MADPFLRDLHRLVNTESKTFQCQKSDFFYCLYRAIFGLEVSNFSKKFVEVNREVNKESLPMPETWVTPTDVESR